MTDQYVTGIDIGGTNTMIGIVDRRGNIVERAKLSTTAFDAFDDFIKAIAETITDIACRKGINGQIRAIGVGAPCVNHINGVIEGAANLPWPSPLPLKEKLEKATGLSVYSANDANAAAIGEMTYGAAKGLKNFIVLTLGTGIGSGIVCDGHLLFGANGFAGELGHILIRKHNGRPCGCGRRGCLDTYCSARGVVRTAMELLDSGRYVSVLNALPRESITSKEIYEAAKDGDELALEVFRVTGELLGEACADFVAFSSPDAIILFGGVARAAEFFIEPMKESMERYMLHIYRHQVRILTSQLSESDSAILGASALGWEP